MAAAADRGAALRFADWLPTGLLPARAPSAVEPAWLALARKRIVSGCSPNACYVCCALYIHIDDVANCVSSAAVAAVLSASKTGVASRRRSAKRCTAASLSSLVCPPPDCARAARARHVAPGTMTRSRKRQRAEAAAAAPAEEAGAEAAAAPAVKRTYDKPSAFLAQWLWKRESKCAAGRRRRSRGARAAAALVTAPLLSQIGQGAV